MSNFTNNIPNTNNSSNTNKIAFNFCNNCGKLGHNYQLCKMPITSIGFIAFTNNHNKIIDNAEGNKNNFKFLMIRRKDSLGYVDFLRGRYKVNNLEYLQNMINEMTNDEKDRLLNKGFDELWTNLWGCDLGMNNRGEEKLSRDKFNNLRNGISIDSKFINLENIIKKSAGIFKIILGCSLKAFSATLKLFLLHIVINIPLLFSSKIHLCNSV